MHSGHSLSDPHLRRPLPPTALHFLSLSPRSLSPCISSASNAGRLTTLPQPATPPRATRTPRSPRRAQHNQQSALPKQPKRVRIAAEPKAPVAPVRTSPRRLAKKVATDGAGADVPGPEQEPVPATDVVAAAQDDAMEVDVVGDDAPAPEPVQATPKASAKKGGGAKKAAPKKPAAKRKAAAPKKRAPKGGPKGQRTKKAAPAPATVEQPVVDTITAPSPQHESAPESLLIVPVAEFTFRVRLTSSPEPSPTSTAEIVFDLGNNAALPHPTKRDPRPQTPPAARSQGFRGMAALHRPHVRMLVSDALFSDLLHALANHLRLRRV